MTLNEILTDLNNRIGSEPEIDNAGMTPWVNQGLLTFCNAYDFHWLKKISYASTIAGQTQYKVPSDMKRMLELKIDGDRYKYVLYERRDLEDSGTKYYSILNNNIYINPAPPATVSANMEMAYVRRPTKMTDGTQSPSDSDIAGLPEVYHEALVLYAFSNYNTYDEEHGEARALMGNELRPVPGTFYYYIKTAKTEEEQRKRGQRNKMMGTRKAYGYSVPNSSGWSSTILGN